MTISSDISIAKSEATSRRLSRQLALQLLFQQEFQAKHADWEDNFWAEHQSASIHVRAFATKILKGVRTYQTEIDQLIQRFAVDWSLARMPVVDRNILRCAIYELIWESEIPAAVTINEAVELAKRFADDEAQRFVNGLLDHILRDEERLLEKRQQLKSTVSQFEGVQPKSTP